VLLIPHQRTPLLSSRRAVAAMLTPACGSPWPQARRSALLQPAFAQRGLFVRLRRYAAIFKSKQMLNSKTNCASDLSSSLRRSAVWRRGLAKKYDDARAGRAADTLDQLAREAGRLPDSLWTKLQSHYSWSSGRWSDSVSEVSRLVEFRGVNTLPDFVDRLVSILSRPSIAA
jgi:hypothetical protein